MSSSGNGGNGFSFGGTGGAGFSLGGTSTGVGGLGGTASSGSTTSGGGFSFGSTPTPAPGPSSGGNTTFSSGTSGTSTGFGATGTSSASVGGFGFGATTAGPSGGAPAFPSGGSGNSTASTGERGFGVGGSTSSAGFNFGNNTTQPSGATTQLSGATGSSNEIGKGSNTAAGGGAFSFGSQNSSSGSFLDGTLGEKRLPTTKESGFNLPSGNNADSSSNLSFPLGSRSTQSEDNQGGEYSTKLGAGGFSGLVSAPSASGNAFGSEQKSAKRAGIEEDSGRSGAGGTKSASSSAGGFSFGGSQSAGSETNSQSQSTPPAPFGGLNNVLGTPSISSNVPPTPGPPAPVATPGEPAEQSGRPPNQSPAVNTRTTSVPPSELAPLEYQTLTVEQILNKFQKELENDALAYLEEARRVAEYDAILRDAQRDIMSLTQKTHRCLLEQKEVEQVLIGVGALQEELDRTLTTVEHNVDELFKSQSHIAPGDADFEREKAYTRASDIEVRLQDLSDTLKTTMTEMDATLERVLPGDYGKIVKILSQHQHSLVELESASRRMEQDINQANHLLEQR